MIRGATSRAVAAASLVISSIALLACSVQPDEARSEAAEHRSVARTQHQYLCDDGKWVTLAVLDKGLAMNVWEQPGGVSQRLTAPAANMPFSNDVLTVTHSNEAVAIMRPDKPARVCRPVTDGSDQTPLGHGEVRPPTT